MDRLPWAPTVGCWWLYLLLHNTGPGFQDVDFVSKNHNTLSTWVSSMAQMLLLIKILLFLSGFKRAKAVAELTLSPSQWENAEHVPVFFSVCKDLFLFGWKAELLKIFRPLVHSPGDCGAWDEPGLCCSFTSAVKASWIAGGIEPAIIQVAGAAGCNLPAVAQCCPLALFLRGFVMFIIGCMNLGCLKNEWFYPLGDQISNTGTLLDTFKLYSNHSRGKWEKMRFCLFVCFFVGGLGKEKADWQILQRHKDLPSAG